MAGANLRQCLISILLIACGCASQITPMYKAKYIALSHIAREHGMQLGWKSRERRAFLENEQCRVIIEPGTDVVWIGDTSTQMPLPAYINDQEVYIPLSFYHEQLKPAVSARKKPVEAESERPAATEIQIAKLRTPALIAVDPGHGGRDPGATGVDGIVEKDYALAIAEKLSACLREAGAQVLLTRTDDSFVELEKRAAMAGSSHADCFVSIHLNSHNTDLAQGFEIWVNRKQEERQRQSLSLATEIHRIVKHAVPLRDRGIKKSAFVVLEKTEMPAVLIECAFISNPEDARWISQTDRQHLLAVAICNGIVTYFNRP